jgi:hypothetical protein
VRLSLVRFTVGTLLFAVAVVAVNCWLFLDEEFSKELLPIGALPLCNVALIGTWLFAKKQLRAIFRGRAADPRSPLSGVTFFSLHFLMLGGFVSLLRPDSIDFADDLLRDIQDYAENIWEAVFGEPAWKGAGFILHYLVPCAVLSGPFLLLSWVGQLLATRCAETVPRQRFRVVTGLVSFGFASVALAIGLTPHPFGHSQEVALDFQVVEKGSGLPIVDASIRMSDPFRVGRIPNSTSASTDASGRARLLERYFVSGERNAFRTVESFQTVTVWGRWLEISAANHRTVRMSLTKALVPSIHPARPTVGRIVLERGQTDASSFQDLAGTYQELKDVSFFQVEPDGRFAWYVLGWHLTPGYRPYGYLRRHGREIELDPIPDPRGEMQAAMPHEYRAIEWRHRLYVCADDTHVLRRFCRIALIPERLLQPHDMDGIYLRESDRNKPQTGLPRLPLEVWARCLASELSLDDEESGLRLALGFVLPKFPRNRRGQLQEVSTGSGRFRLQR